GGRPKALRTDRVVISWNRSRPDRQHKRLFCPVDSADQEKPDQRAKPARGPNLREQLFAIAMIARFYRIARHASSMTDSRVQLKSHLWDGTIPALGRNVGESAPGAARLATL